MKKVFLILLVFIMALSLCACNSSEPVAEPSGESSAEVTSSTNETVPESVTETTDQTAEQIQIDITEQNALTIEGEQYALPMSVKAFLDTGWNDTYNHMGEKIEVDTGKEYPSFTLDKNGEEKISGIGAYNYTDKEITVEQSALISLKLVGISDDSRLTQCSFTLPGGITEKSTYEEVLAAYGTKTESEYYRVADDYESKSKDAESFEKYGFTVLYNSKDAAVVPYSYMFAFNADKTIKHVEVKCADFKSAASAAFDK